ncbi:MAG TPA: hypothetical protein VHF22_05670 [Planctomycetota bacterium]|nr:hypothetical protein [Planctomycetota bacterium]
MRAGSSVIMYDHGGHAFDGLANDGNANHFDDYVRFMNEGPGTTYNLDFETGAAVTISGINVFGARDASPSGVFIGAMSHLAFCADTDGDGAFELLVQQDVDPTYGASFPTFADLDLPVTFGGPVTSRVWRLEVTQATPSSSLSSNDSVFLREIDATSAPGAPGVPEPAAMSLAAIGAAGAAPRARRRR